MEFWMIVTKLTLLVYIGVSYVSSHTLNQPWVVLALLIYICMNLFFYVVGRKTLKQLPHLLTIIFIFVVYYTVYPLFIVLLPLAVFELTSFYIKKKWIILLFAFVPELFITETLWIHYGIFTLLEFLIYIMAVIYTDRLANYETRIDTMRKGMKKLSARLNHNEAFIRQSEYLYKLEERNRISQEIHDRIGHTMTGALIQMEAAKRMMQTDNVQTAIDLLQNAINISNEGIERIRVTLKQMKPPQEQIGINRMKLMIDDFTTNHQLSVPFTYKGNLDVISPVQWKVIHENVGEALTNALKYADATTISIDIQVLNKLVKTEVKDNGRGADKVKKGLGIVGMEERTATVGGKIIIDGTDGFSVTTLLPVEQ